MINSVRNTVLSVLNKNNYGYISPSDFNLYAKQAQIEFFEEYFSSYNKSVNMENSRMSGTEYADIKQAIEQTIEIFSEQNHLSQVANNTYHMPSMTTTGDDCYLLNKVLCYIQLTTSGTNTSTVTHQLIDAGANFTASGVKVGDIVINSDSDKTATVVGIISSTVLALSENIFPTANKPYLIYDSSYISEAEKVTQSNITRLNMSLQTTPNTRFPAFIKQGDTISVYPATINKKGQIFGQYFRFPKDPKWTYITLSGGSPVFDQSQSDYQDFELPPEDEYKLVIKILQYCGVSIREIEVAQFAIAQEQHEQPTFSQKQ